MNFNAIFCSSTVVAFAMSVASCKPRKSNNDNFGSNSADSQVKQAHYVSCQKNDSGSTTRCVQYDLNGLNPTFVSDWIKGSCGQADKGFGGFSYVDAPCPTDSRLGECVPNKPALVSSDFYYTSGYSTESAAQACQDLDGSWTAP